MPVPELTPTEEPQLVMRHDVKYERKEEKHSSEKTKHRASAHVATPSQGYKYECVLCRPEKHPLYQCQRFLEMDVQTRRDNAKTFRLCFNCFIPGHRNTECRNPGTCRQCSGKHNTLLHLNPSTESRASAHLSIISSSSGPPNVLTMTANVLLTGTRGRTYIARTLIDPGATNTLVSTKAVQILQLPTTSWNMSITGIQAVKTKPSNKITTLSISPLQKPSQRMQITAAVLERLTMDLPALRASEVKQLPHLQGLTLADPNFDIPGRIDLLIGSDLMEQVLLMEAKRGPPNTASAYNTIFGWAIFGQYGQENGDGSINVSQNTPMHDEDPGNKILQRFWEIEEPANHVEAFTPEESEAQNHYDINHKYVPSNCRYVVKLPRKLGAPELGESRTQALQRFRANESSTMRKGTWEQFQRVIQEYLDLQHAQLVKNPDRATLNSMPLYLPMHAVLKESSTSTKLRVVFDASASTSTGISLNETLMVGPTLHPTLETILLRFRSYNIALTGDIAKMYRAVELAPEDRHLHRFLWRKNTSDPICEYEMNRVTFGVASSPHLAVQTLQQTAHDHSTHPLASYHICQSFYVDDLLGGACNIKQANLLRVSLCETLAKGGFKGGRTPEVKTPPLTPTLN